MPDILQRVFDIPREFWVTLSEMSPYLLLGFFVAGFLSILVPPAMVERHLGGKGLWPVVKAAIFGVPLPLCSCGVVPVAASLKRHHATNGATTAFLLTTPETGIDSILVTYSLLGWVIAIVRPIAAVVSGIIGGTAVTLIEEKENSKAEAAACKPGAPECKGACCSVEPGQGKIAHALHYGFLTLPQDLGKALLVGVVIGAVITALLGGHAYFKDVTSAGGGIVGMLVMMAVGMATYVCATASVPIAAAFIAAGVSPGAAMVFLMTGPASNAAMVTMVWKIMGRRTAIVYVCTVVAVSLAVGFIVNGIAAAGVNLGVMTMRHEHAMGMSIFHAACAVALLGLVGLGIWRGRTGRKEAEKESLSEVETILTIGGMRCTHCAAAIERAIGECAGVTEAKVHLNTKKAIVRGGSADMKAVREKILGLGYTIEENGEKKEKEERQ